MRTLVICLISLIFAVGLGSVAVADQCEKTLIPSTAAGVYGYLERGDGRRCEGIYVSPVSGFPVELVSLSYGIFDFDYSKPITLLLGLAVRPPLSSPLHIRAIGIPEALYYQLDASVPVGQTITWPLQDVVQPEKIPLTDIGVYAFQTDQNANTILLPVEISRVGSTTPKGQPIVITLRVGAVSNLKWRYIDSIATLPPYTSTDAEGRLTITLPITAKLPGRLEIRWDEVTTGRARVRTFDIGG